MCTTMNSVKRAKGRSISKFLIWPSLAVAFVCFALAPVAAEGPSSRAPQTLRSLYEQLQKKPRLAKEISAARTSASSPLFFEAPEYDTGPTPTFVATGDFNDDGKVDLAVANYCVDPTSYESCLQFGSSVNVLLGNGDGTFRTHVDYLTGTGSTSLVVGDFNHDGKEDIAAANICRNALCAESSISVLLGKGNGTFHPHMDYATGPAPYSIAAGDLNGDGKEDLVTADFVNAVSVLLGNGDGSFQLNIDNLMSCSGADFCAAEAVVIGDFNGDHKPDLVTANYYGFNLSLFMGNGDGTFQPQADFASLGNPSTLTVGDLNGDGRLDIVTNAISCNNTDVVVVLLGNGDGTFQLQVAYFTGVNCGATQVALGEFNGDNKPDLVSVNFLGNSVSVFPGVGDGTFPLHEAWGTGVAPDGVAVGDFNGDGRNDIAALNVVGTISVLLGNGDNTFQARIDSDTFVDPYALASADFNRDGKIDVVTTDGIYSKVSILLCNGDGTFQTHVDYDTPTGPFSVVVGDFNLDRKPDFAVSERCDSGCPSSFMSVFLGNGNGTFRPRVDYPVPFGAFALATEDFNADGKPDLVVAFSGYPPEGLRFFLGNGDGTFRAPVDLPMAAVAGVIAADFNGDGKWDLATMNGSDTVSIVLGNGDGTFQAPVNYSTPPGLVFSAAAGDINGDNKPDLVTTSISGYNAGLVSVYMGNGDGTFHPHVDYDAGGSVWSVAIGDFDGDQHADLALPFGNGVSVNIWRGNGDGTFNPPTGYVTGWGPIGVAVTDFNADGRPDLAVTNKVSYTVSVLLNIADIPVFTLAANFTGTGGGTVTFNPWGTTCSSNCSKSYANGTQIALTANPSAGSTFTSWSGGGCSGIGTCSLTLTSDQTVTANFDLIPDFAVAVSALSPGTVNPGQSASSTIDVTAIAGFNSAVVLTCLVSPKPQLAPQCSISPGSVTPGSPATLTVTTTGPQAGMASPLGRAEIFYAMGLPVFGLALATMVFPVKRKKTRLLGMLFCVLLFATLLLLPGCGGSSSGGPRGSRGTPAGNYTITVTGTSGSTHSTTVTLKVQ